MKKKSYLPEVIYTPESRLRNPLKLCQEMWRDLLASRELAWRLMVRDINAQYRQSFLGITWAFLPPIMMAVGFTLAKESNVINIGKTDLPYPAYVMFSAALWQTFVEAINGPVQAMRLAKPMLARVNFPREALILAKLGEIFFNFGIKLILIIGLFIYFKVNIYWTFILAFVAIIHLILLGTFIGLLLTPFALLYDDISRGINLITGFWLFLTPVVYPIPNSGAFSILVKLNPVTPILVTARELATTGLVSNPLGFWLVSLLTFIFLFFTWVAFRLAMPFVIERVGA